ncbi:MAG TPA: CPBP family intramembrane glutamic endopeptidase [Acidimicrobiales bacterium]|nr:CPBP family intramembrane glutamic endopeptidase [Acidimicrobiales bacterium]
MTDRPVVGEPAPSPPLPEPEWGLGDAALGFFLGLWLSVAFSVVWVGVSGQGTGDLGTFVASVVGLWTGLGAALANACLRKGSRSLAVDFGLRVERSDILPGVIAGVASQLVMIPLLYLPFRLLGHDLDVSEKAKEVTDLAKGAGVVVIPLLIVVGAPLVEELFFRGLLQRSVARRLGPVAAVAISAVTFGVAHFQPVQLLGLVAFGVVLGILAQRAGRLGPSLIAHMCFNAVTVVILLTNH